MADNQSYSQWTNSTWNPITGCTRVSRGCEHCYAETLAAGRLKHHPSRAGLTDDHGRWNGVVRFNQKWLNQPFGWKKPRRVFVVAHGDLFHENVPDEWIDWVFAVMAMNRQHVFQILTKSPDRMYRYLSEMVGDHRGNTVIERLEDLINYQYEGRLVTWPWAHTEAERWPLRNVWAGTSVEDCVVAAERIPNLLRTPAAVRWISAEPLLAPIDISPYFRRNLPGDASTWSQPTGLDWVVCGGESGPGYRPMEPDWARFMRDQCKLAGVPFFMKQAAGKAAIPADLMIREYPA